MIRRVVHDAAVVAVTLAAVRIAQGRRQAAYWYPTAPPSPPYPSQFVPFHRADYYGWKR